MKFNCGQSKIVKIQRLEQWHDWFAWYPVRVDENDCRWLEKVQRIGSLKWYGDPCAWWEWEYKSRENKDELR